MALLCLATCVRLGLPRLPKGCGPKHADCGARLQFRSSVAGAERVCDAEQSEA